MCGIYGYIGDKNAYLEVKNGLKQLQYRGYDSCGIAYYENEFKIEKALGTLDNLQDIANKNNIAFGHTRWATNGEVNIPNTHPHVSNKKEFVIVHNGIITNVEDIKTNLLSEGYNFYSQTDTEVIANLLESMDDTTLDRIKALFNILEGSFSLIIGDEYGRLYAVRQFSPLHVLKASDGIYISSDINSLPDGELYSLNDGDVLMIENGSIISDNNICFTEHKSKIKKFVLNGYNHFMQKEIFETPKAIKNTYNSLKNQKIKQIFKHFNKITMLGCGTAYNSCLIGEWLFNEYTKKQVDSYLASNYKVKKISKGHLHIIVTQSGETADCIKVAREIKKLHGKILVITNEGRSSITECADYKIVTKAEKEIAVASTKTYSCQIFTFAYIVNLLNNKAYDLDIREFTDKVADFIAQLDITKYAQIMANCKHLILIGKDIDYLTIVEASLKIREIDYIYTIPMFANELKHGTLSLIDEKAIVLSLNSNKNINISTTKNEIVSRNGTLLEFDNIIQSVDVDKKYLPIFSIIPFQLISYEIAILKGLNPDMPRNLAKSVTVE